MQEAEESDSIFCNLGQGQGHGSWATSTGNSFWKRGYKQGLADGRDAKTGKPTAQVEPKSRIWLVCN